MSIYEGLFQGTGNMNDHTHAPAGSSPPSGCRSPWWPDAEIYRRDSYSCKSSNRAGVGADMKTSQRKWVQRGRYCAFMSWQRANKSKYLEGSHSARYNHAMLFVLVLQQIEICFRTHTTSPVSPQSKIKLFVVRTFAQNAWSLGSYVFVLGRDKNYLHLHLLALL